MSAKERRPWKRLGHFASGAALLCVFVAASGSALLFHLDLPAGRRFAAHAVAGFLTDFFKGSFEIDEFSKLTSTRFVAGEVTVKDPEGRIVLRVKELRAEFDSLHIARQLLSGASDVTIELPHIRGERAEAYIIPHPRTGMVSIGTTFELERTTPSKKPRTKAARVVRVFMPNVELGSGFARGNVGNSPTLEAELTNARGKILIGPEGVSVDVPRFATAWRGITGADLKGIGSFHLRGDRHFWSSFDGYVGDLQLNTVVRLQDGQLSIAADIPQAPPEAVRALWPDWPVQVVADGHVEASGTPQHLATTAKLKVGGAELEGVGVTRLSGDVGVNLDITGRNVDLRSIWPKAPESAINAFTTLSLWNSPNGVVVELNGSTEPTQLAGIDIPALDVTGTVEESVFEARATAHEPGLPLRIDLTVKPKGIIELVVRARRFRLEKSPRVQQLISARGTADVTIKGRIENENVDATLVADVEALKLSGLALGRGRIEARGRGRLDRPKELMLDTRVTGTELEALNRRWQTVRAQARGPVLHPEVTASLTQSGGLDVDGKARVSFEGKPRVNALELALRHDGGEVKASATHVAVSDERIEIKDLSVIGAGGDLKGSVLITPRLVEIEARGQEVDLDALSQLAGLPRGQLGGKLTIDADATVAEDVQRGHVSAELKRGSIQGISGLGLALEASLDDTRVDGSARAEVAGVARGATQFNLELAGAAADPDSWRRAIGRIEVRLDEADLSHLVFVLPPKARIEEIEGKLSGQVIITREQPDDLPSLTVLGGTNGLRIVQAAERASDPPLTIEGIEAQLGSRVDGPTGEVDATVRLLDHVGSLASGSARTRLPLQELLEHPERLVAELTRASLQGKLVVDERSLETLPAPFKPKAMRGVVRAEATLGGTFQDPIVSAKASALRLAIGLSREVVPADVCVQADYSRETSAVSLVGQAFLTDDNDPCSGKRVGHLRAAGTLNLAAPATPEGPPRVFAGEAGLVLEGLPLEMIGPLGASGVRGEAHGVIALTQHDALPQLNAQLGLNNVRVETIAVGNGRLSVRSDGETLRALAAFEQGQGKLDSEFNAALAWEGLTPSLDRNQPLLLEARARKVDAVMLLPPLRDVFAELNGAIDGRVRLSLEPDLQSEESRWHGDLEGELAMENGSMQFNGLGMRLSDVRFTARTVERGGRTVIEVRNFSAASRARSPNISATGDVYFERLELLRARANVNLRDVPILIQGVSQAHATGRAFVELLPGEDKMRLRVSLPQLNAELPPSSGRDVLPIDNNRSIEVLQPLTEPRQRTSAAEPPLPWELRFVIGNDVKVVRSDMTVPIDGEAIIALGEETNVSGTIDLKPGGRVQLLGKTFVIENGEVRFDTEDPSNPHLRVLASWRAPDGTIVYLNVTGTFREAKLEPKSDPPLPETEIYALLLGGSTGEESGSAAATGIGLGAGVLGRVLSDTPLRNVEIRTGSEQTFDERTYSTYTAAVQISDEIWFEGSYKALNANEQDDRDEAFSGTVDWRFRKNWSLRTEVGTIGAGLDLLWTYHY